MGFKVFDSYMICVIIINNLQYLEYSGYVS